ncbi:CopD family protein [Pannonibacter sp. Pt2-lr]
MIAGLKFLHIAGLASWSAALLAMPLLMRAHGSADNQRQYARFRLITHIGYIGFATPAALITIIAGTGLIFAAGVFEPWLLLKLSFVAAMVLVHAWIGHLIQRSGEERRSHWRAAPCGPADGSAADRGHPRSGAGQAGSRRGLHRPHSRSAAFAAQGAL